MIQVNFDPESPAFLTPLKLGSLLGVPVEITMPEKKGIHMNGRTNNSHDSVTSVIFEESYGIIVTNYLANLKLYDPLYFEECWSHQEMNLVDFTSRYDIICFVTSRYSPAFAYLAIGCGDGKVFLFNMSSRHKIGCNTDAHKAEIK